MILWIFNDLFVSSCRYPRDLKCIQGALQYWFAWRLDAPSLGHPLATLFRSQTTWAWLSILELSLEWDPYFFMISVFDSTKTEGFQAIPTSQQILVYPKLIMIRNTPQISTMCSRWCERFWVRSLWETKFEWWQIIEHWYELTIALQLAKSCLIHWWRLAIKALNCHPLRINGGKYNMSKSWHLSTLFLHMLFQFSRTFPFSVTLSYF
jgi:hypothetical protein